MIQSIYDQLIIFAFIQSLFLLGVLMLSPRYRAHINVHMIVLIAALAMGLGGKIAYMYGAWGGTLRLVMLSEVATLLFGSSIYLFVRSHLRGVSVSRRDLYHYLPAIGYVTVLVIYFFLPSRETMRARSDSGELLRVVYIFHAFGLMVNAAYWVLSWQVYRRFHRESERESSYSVETKFFYWLLVLMGIGWVTWIAIYIYSLVQTYGMGHSEMGQFEIQMRLFIWLAIGFIVLFLSFYAITYPRVFQSLPELTSRKYAQSKLSTDDLDRLKADLDQLMESKKPYLNNKLLKSELAQLMGIPSPELARLLNERIGMNFFDYVNYYRIKEFIALAQEDKSKNYTFYGLAQEAGFNSKTTFNKSFKKLMGQSPSQYFKNQ